MDRAKDYLDKVYEDVTVPSGHVFTMQEPDIIAVAEFMQAVGIDMADKDMADKLNALSFADNLKASLTCLLPAACVNPRVALEPTEEGIIPIRSLKPGDQVFLVAWCTRRIAMDTEGFDERKFRELIDAGTTSR